jgi:ACT domain-containing protein
MNVKEYINNPEYENINNGIFLKKSEDSKKLKELISSNELSPYDAIIRVYGDFDRFYKSKDVIINFHEVFSLKDKE